MKSFQGKIIWITGASSGIGEALAYAFAAKGARLILSARRKEELERVKAATGLADTDVLVLPLDMTEIATFPEKVQQVLDTFKTVDILIQNAGISQRSLVHETALEVDRQLMEVDYFGVVALTKAILPHWRARKAGYLVAVSSVAGYVATPLRSSYAAAKHAIRAFCDALRAENDQLGIRVTVVCPGYIRTDLPLHALRGDGGLHGRMDENQKKGMTAEACAAQIVQAIKAEKRETYPGGREVMGIYLKRWFPGVLARVIRNWNEA